MFTQKTLFVGLFGASITFSIVACSDDSEEDAARKASELAALETKVLASCNYRYTCERVESPLFPHVWSPDAGMEEEMHRWSDGQCVASDIQLAAGGKGVYTTYIDASDPSSGTTSHPVTWKIEGAVFQVCESDDCVKCTVLNPPDAPNGEKKEGKCTGSSSSCYGRAAGSCGSQEGCYAGWHIRWNGDMEFECKGSSDSCSSFSSETSCKRQDGCRWE
jgi:hypothetical protein